KWSEINLMMREKLISLLTLQDMYLSDEYTREVLALYGKRLSIHSSDTEHSTGRSSVAIVLNKDLVKTEGVVTTYLIPGRALLVQIPWHGETMCTWLAIYALNNEEENRKMWEDLTTL
ncbi:hypothetical protein ARMGADRAFT_946396, partial [Armillaria gallica]